jgi:hypothetical protein
MVTRVTQDELRPLLEGFDGGRDLQIYIDQANVLVEEDLSGTGQSDARLRIIELNLAAHFAVVSIERGGLTMQRRGESEEGYATDRSQINFSSTRFGQQAITMDASGKLSTMNAPGGRAEFKVY